MNFFHTHVSPRCIELVAETLQSTFISEGRRVEEFERALAAELGLVRPVAVNSGTSALHLALAVAGVGRGDEVILPAQTFIASGMAILMAGARPVFADIQLHSGNLDPVALPTRITSRTRVIMPVHWAGCPCDMEEINAVAREHRVSVVEDAAHALCATYQGRPVGSLSRFTAFSFQAIKHLTTGDGGAICCLDEQDYQSARRRRWFGIDRTQDKSTMLGERAYNVDRVGYKYHLNDLGAAVGLGNLPDLQSTVRRHREIADRYLVSLANVQGLQSIQVPPDRESSWWFFPMLVDRREDFIRAMQGRGVPASVVHQRIDRNEVFGGPFEDLTQQTEFDRRHVALPIHRGLGDDDVEKVIASVVAGW